MADLTDEIYYASKDPRKNALQQLPYERREAAARELDAAGLVIDRAIDIWGWDPTKIMAIRLQYGQPFELDGINGTKVIKNSMNAADYPPFAQAPPPLPPVKPVGSLAGNGTYLVNISACVNMHGDLLFTNGQHYIQDGVEYIFHAIQFWGVPSVSWSRA